MPSEGLKTALNAMREMSVKDGSIYHQYVPVVTDETSIGEFGTPILDRSNTNVLNEFVGLLQKVVFTAVETKLFDNPLQMLEGENMPLGRFIEDVYVNPAKARQFNINDFAGLLQKYDAEVAVQYFSVNSDLQYCVTITRDKLRNAFTSWSNLENLISGYVNSLYNGCYIDRYNATKALISGAYAANKVKIEEVSAVTSEATGKALITKIRSTLAKMKVPSANYNAWHQVKGDGLDLQVWSDPSDMVVFLNADVDAITSVEVLARAFNMSETDFMARVIVVDNFDIVDRETGEKTFDGSAIQAFVADRGWFKIKQQDFDMEDFRNPNNRTIQYYLNDTRMYNYSFFHNAVIFATSTPTIDVETLDFNTDTVEIDAGDHEGLDITITPPQANETITYTCTAAPVGGDTDDITLTASDNGRHLDIAVDAGAEDGDYTVTATTTSGISETLTVTVPASA